MSANFKVKSEDTKLPSHRAPVDTPLSLAEHDDMNARVAKLEADVAAVRTDVAVIKANGATKADIAEAKGSLKGDIADAKSAIIIWVVTAFFVAQLIPSFIKVIDTHINNPAVATDKARPPAQTRP